MEGFLYHVVKTLSNWTLGKEMLCIYAINDLPWFGDLNKKKEA